MSKWSRYAKVDFPFPVVTEFELFCEGCTEADLNSWTNRIHGNETEIVKNVVSCYHIDRCRKLFEQFRRVENEIH